MALGAAKAGPGVAWVARAALAVAKAVGSVVAREVAEVVAREAAQAAVAREAARAVAMGGAESEEEVLAMVEEVERAPGRVAEKTVEGVRVAWQAEA